MKTSSSHLQDPPLAAGQHGSLPSACHVDQQLLVGELVDEEDKPLDITAWRVGTS